MTALRDHLVFLDGELPALGEAFYGRLFELHPETKPLFGVASRAARKQMLMQILSSVIDIDEPWVQDELNTLGHRHRTDWDITPQMYDWVRDALYDALRTTSGPTWTPELAAIWTTRLDAVCSAAAQGSITDEDTA